jgi:hypothetical protein
MYIKNNISWPDAARYSDILNSYKIPFKLIVDSFTRCTIKIENITTEQLKNIFGGSENEIL